MTRLRFRCLLAIFAGVFGSVSAEMLPSKPAGYFNDYATGSIARRRSGSTNNWRSSNARLRTRWWSRFTRRCKANRRRGLHAASPKAGASARKTAMARSYSFFPNHKMFIQIGYGLEGALPDMTAFDITETDRAEVQTDDYDGGLAAGNHAIMKAVRGEYKGSGKTHLESKSGASGIPVGLIIFCSRCDLPHLHTLRSHGPPWLRLQRLGRSLYRRVRRWRWRLRWRQFGRRRI